MKLQSMRLTKWCSFALLLSITLIHACGNNTNNHGAATMLQVRLLRATRVCKKLTELTSVSNSFTHKRSTAGLSLPKRKAIYAVMSFQLAVSPHSPQVFSTYRSPLSKAQIRHHASR